MEGERRKSLFPCVSQFVKLLLGFSALITRSAILFTSVLYCLVFKSCDSLCLCGIIFVVTMPCYASSLCLMPCVPLSSSLSTVYLVHSSLSRIWVSLFFFLFFIVMELALFQLRVNNGHFQEDCVSQHLGEKGGGLCPGNYCSE